VASTTNSSWLTSTNAEYYEIPYKSVNAPITLPFSVTIADGSMDAVGDVVNLIKLPQSAKLLFIYIAVGDHDDGGQSDIDVQYVEISGGTTTTTTLLNSAKAIGGTAYAEYIFPAVSASFLHEGIPTDDGTATLRLYQIATTVTTDKATTAKGFVVYV